MTKKQADYLTAVGITLVALLVFYVMIMVNPRDAGIFVPVDGMALIAYWVTIIKIHKGKTWRG